jgi:hypothetical protein
MFYTLDFINISRYVEGIHVMDSDDHRFRRRYMGCKLYSTGISGCTTGIPTDNGRYT